MKVTSSLIYKVSSILKSVSAVAMDSTPNLIKSSTHKTDKEVKLAGIEDLSPVTNLTLNLSGLSTSVAGTPIRRISWSNPVPGGSKIGLNPEDLSSNESPTFQEKFPHRNKTRHRIRKCISKILPSDSEDDKENIIPHDEYFKNLHPKNSHDSIPSSSQDSGYSGISEKYCLESPLNSPPMKNKSSFIDEDDSFESIFHLEEMDDHDKMSPVPESMSSLMTKPMSKDPISPHHPPKSRFGKLPIRRCLSREMDSDCDSPSSEKNLKIETYGESSSLKDKFYLDLDIPYKTIFKRPDPPNNYLTSYKKRRKSSPSIEPTCVHEETMEESFVFQRSFSETAATIMHALLKADLQPELIGDGSRSYALPLVKGRHHDLKSISPETLAGLLKGEFQNKIENFTLVDCRYPYEYEGGHIQGAKNIYTKEDIMSTFLEGSISGDQRSAVIFHCEFSSERAPTLCRFLRNKDREINEGNYPHLNHPEIYILEGGYKAFFENHKEFCVPQEYKPMNHKDHGFDLRHFRAKSKSWGNDSKGRSKLRSNSKHTLI